MPLILHWRKPEAHLVRAFLLGGVPGSGLETDQCGRAEVTLKFLSRTTFPEDGAISSAMNVGACGRRLTQCAGSNS